MKTAGKWNYKTHSYDLIAIPEACILYTNNMDAQTVCAQCGKKIAYGSSYSSMEIQTSMGFGYPVCPECHDAELKRRIENQEKKK